jgi:hypothetical protein
MMGLLATAHTWTGGEDHYTLAPIAGVLLTLFAIRTILRMRIGVVAAVVAVALGAIFATLGASAGYSVAVSVWLLSFAAVAAVRRGARPLHGSASD